MKINYNSCVFFFNIFFDYYFLTYFMKPNYNYYFFFFDISKLQVFFVFVILFDYFLNLFHESKLQFLLLHFRYLLLFVYLTIRVSILLLLLSGVSKMECPLVEFLSTISILVSFYFELLRFSLHVFFPSHLWMTTGLSCCSLSSATYRPSNGVNAIVNNTI